MMFCFSCASSWINAASFSKVGIIHENQKNKHLVIIVQIPHFLLKIVFTNRATNDTIRCKKGIKE